MIVKVTQKCLWKQGGFAPPPLEAETRFTFGDIQKFGNLFKQLLAESPSVKWSIIAAGIASVLETVQILLECGLTGKRIEYPCLFLNPTPGALGLVPEWSNAGT